jgi:GT2 family glycosyltransferase
MVQFLDANDRYGAVAPRILDPDGRHQRTFYGLPRALVTPLAQALARWRPGSRELRRLRQDGFDPEHDADVDGASTACLLLRRRALRKTQPLDEELDFHFVDVDLCDRLRVHGWRIRYAAEATVYHHGGRSAAQLEDSEERWHASRIAYWRKHYGSWGATWIKACTALGFADHLVGELWRRANGGEELPLGPACRLLADCLKA